ncbi:MAG: 16S rRNA (cytosine(1402)-N(4))-methyltransferase RsmH [Candidatus Krumholzibacteria bacterium]|nr:16S rRNA (cytosine(1402)-N(4))-methyltransferase RsmH [Candidatus Krumholzibacteria bacterium]
MPHVPVMVGEVVHRLTREGARLIVDGTVGAGGHAEAILDAAPGAMLLGIDRDPEALALAESRLARFGDRVALVRGSFADLGAALGGRGRAHGILIDLGVSSLQIDRAERGFSYKADAPLDMRMGQEGETAASLLSRTDIDGLAGLLRRYGEVRAARRVAAAVRRACAEGRMATTGDLRRAVASVYGARTTPAELSRVFQAVRIATNGELDALAAFLGAVAEWLEDGARLVVIAYHSLEDRMVKTFLRDASAACVCPPEAPICVCGVQPSFRLLARRAVKASPEEIAANPRARSARLRCAERIRGEVAH